MVTASPPRLSWLLVGISFFAVAGSFLTAAATGRWALAGAPLGFLLGFFLAKGGLCSTAAISEVLVLGSRRKLFGLWVATVTCMVGFAILDGTGLVTLCPRPFAWASYAAGGALFGVGMVLAGGCVSGTLYKCGVGHTNSLVALLSIPVGIQLVDFGPLAGLRSFLADQVIDGPGGGPMTLSSLTGLPYAVLAGVFALATLAVVIRSRKWSGRRAEVAPRARVSRLTRILAGTWRPAVAGIAVGVLAVPVWLTSAASGRDFPLCVTYGVAEAPLLVAPSHVAVVWAPADVREDGAPRVYVWLVLFALAVVPGAHVAARLSGRARWYRRPPEVILAAAAGGLLVGMGAGLAKGCMLGNGISGTAMMSVGMMSFAVVASATNLLMTRWWVMGGGKPPLKRERKGC